MTEDAAPPAFAPANAAQADYWNGRTGHTWAELQGLIDRQMAPLGRELVAALAPRPGERILDVGCGAGASTLALAEGVGGDPGGEVVGIDLSQPLLEVARARPKPAGARIRFERADAQTAALSGFDAVHSRFGVMFFADPQAGFANLLRALKAGGRLAFVCWRAFEDNPVMRAPIEAARPFVPPSPPSDPTAPGPFAFADRGRIESILRSAGFSHVAIRPFDTEVGVGDVEETLKLTRRIGPLGAALREHPELAAPVLEAVREALARHQGPDGQVRLGAAVWIVTAGRP